MGCTIFSTLTFQQQQVQVKKGAVSPGFRPISWFNKWERVSGRLVFQSLCPGLPGGTQSRTVETCKNRAPDVEPVPAAIVHKAFI